MKLSRRNLVLGALLSAFVLTGCGKKEEAANVQAPTTPAAEVKEYVVGTDAAYAPFEFENDQKQAEGFDIDVVTAIADKAGIKVKFINTPWEGIFASLNNGDRDALVSASTITDERKASMDFSEPYFEARQLIVVAKDAKVAKFGDL